jgi:hypothetical protein
VNLGKSVTVGNDVDDKWTDVDIAVKEYDQIILDLVAVEITGTLHFPKSNLSKPSKDIT